MAPSGKSSGVGVESVSSLILCPVVLGGPLPLVLLRVYFVIFSTGKIGKNCDTCSGIQPFITATNM